MTDQLVSIRMPKPLIDELKGLVQENHFLDLSEELRSVIRRGAARYLDPYQHQMSELQVRLEENIRAKNKKLKKEELLRELKKLLEVDA